MVNNNILRSCNTELTLNEFISIIQLGVSVCMLIIAIIGVVCVFRYRAHQKEAIYGFYQNLKTFLYAFQLYTNSSSSCALEWMNILGKKKEDITEAEHKLIKPISNFCLHFFNFLSTSLNQIPPSRKKILNRSGKNHLII